jgi:uncharacterized membrane protein
MSQQPQPTPQTVAHAILNSTALKESGLQYMLIIAISISSLVSLLGWETMLALCLSYLGVVFGGYIKKIGENKMAEILAANKKKDEEILVLKSQVNDLKAIKEKLMEEIKQEVMRAIPHD